MVATICRKFHFNSAHRLHNPHWTDQQNKLVFGKCNNPNYHGHNYELIVKVTGPVDTESGFVMDIKLLKQLVNEKVIDQFDHKNLNVDTAEFKTLNPTAENIAYVIYNKLVSQIDTCNKITIILYETERNYVEYRGE